MDEKTTYPELVKELEDPSSILFAGSLAYIQIEESLSMLKKLLTIKLRKPSELTVDYPGIITISSLVQAEAHKMIIEDGRIFASLRQAKTDEEKTTIVEKVYPTGLAFIENINTICRFLDKIVLLTNGSLAGDFIMLKSYLAASGISLCSILSYEVHKEPVNDQLGPRLEKINGLLDELTMSK